jgi:hypothetical protein
MPWADIDGQRRPEEAVISGSRKLTAGVDRQHLEAAVGFPPPSGVVEIHDRADVVGDHGHAFSDPRPRGAAADIDLGVFLGELADEM